APATSELRDRPLHDALPIFPDRIEAWANGPVVPALYAQHRQKMMVKPGEITGDSSRLTDDERESIDAVIKFYGKRKAFELSDLRSEEHTSELQSRENLVCRL